MLLINVGVFNHFIL